MFFLLLVGALFFVQKMSTPLPPEHEKYRDFLEALYAKRIDEINETERKAVFKSVREFKKAYNTPADFIPSYSDFVAWESSGRNPSTAGIKQPVPFVAPKPNPSLAIKHVYSPPPSSPQASPGSSTPIYSRHQTPQGKRPMTSTPSQPPPPPSTPSLSPITGPGLQYSGYSPGMIRRNQMGGSYHAPPGSTTFGAAYSPLNISNIRSGWAPSPSGPYHSVYKEPFHAGEKRSIHGDTPAQKKAKKEMKKQAKMSNAEAIGHLIQFIASQQGAGVSTGPPSQFASMFGSGGASGIGSPAPPNTGSSSGSSSGSGSAPSGGLQPGGGIGGGSQGAGGGSGANVPGGSSAPGGPPPPGAGGSGSVGQAVAQGAQAQQQAGNTEPETGQTGTYEEGGSEFPEYAGETFGHETQNVGSDVLTRESKGEAPANPYGGPESQTGLVEKASQPDPNRSEPITKETGSKQNPATANSIVGASELAADAMKHTQKEVLGTPRELANMGKGERSGWEFSGPYDFPERGTSNLQDATLTHVGAWRSKTGERTHSLWKSSVTNRGAPSKNPTYWKYTTDPWGGRWKRAGAGGSKYGKTKSEARSNYISKVDARKQGANWMNTATPGSTLSEHFANMSKKLPEGKFAKYQRRRQEANIRLGRIGNEIKNARMASGANASVQM